jgi:hypothetical protein
MYTVWTNTEDDMNPNEWHKFHGSFETPPGLDAAKVIAGMYNSRLRIAGFLAKQENIVTRYGQVIALSGVERDVFIDAVMMAPAAIYHGNGTMSPIDWAAIGRQAVADWKDSQ